MNHSYSYSQTHIPTGFSYKTTISQESFQRVEKLHNQIPYSLNFPLKKSLLNKLKNRKAPEEFSVDPVLAATVVKKYLLPMFEKTKLNDINANRKQMMGLSQTELFGSRNSTAESSVFKELKLSERLLKELEFSNQKIKESEDKLTVFEQEKFELQAEIENLKTIYTNCNINSELNLLMLNQQAKNNHMNEMKNYLVYKQLENYKRMYKESEEKLHDASEELINEKNMNDIRLKM